VKKDCPYCQKLGALEYLPAAELVWQFPHSVALLGPWQYYLGYCILASRTHATELNQLPEAERRAYLDEMCLLARAIEDCFHPHKLNYELLGNQVPHLHWHVIPRYKGDPELLQPAWFAFERTKTDRSERQRLLSGPLKNEAVANTMREWLRQATDRSQESGIRSQ